jgi:predicted TPR repeat methyltransferase
MGYAHALRDKKLYPAAALQFNAAAKLKPSETKTWVELGGMLYMAGDHEHALEALAQARQLGDDSPGNWFLSAIMLDGAHQLKPALAAYRRFLSLSQGKSPDQEFQARQRAKLIQRELDNQ